MSTSYSKKIGKVNIQSTDFVSDTTLKKARIPPEYEKALQYNITVQLRKTLMKAIMMLEMLSQCVPQSIINRAKEKGKRGTIYSQIIL